MPANRHHNEPRNVAYSKENEKYYSIRQPESYLRTDSSTIFAGAMQVDLFLMCIGLARYYGQKPKELKSRVANIPTNALGEPGKWLILGLGMVDTGDLSCLNDEEPLYRTAEQYAEAGFPILQSLLQEHGSGFPGFLESTLKKIVENRKETKLLITDQQE